MTAVLVVEDDAIIGTHISETLIRLGYEVPARVDSGEAALRAAAEHKPDLVLMDVQLRGPVDGVEAASRLRRDSDIPVVYLTAHSDDATLARASETGPHGYLVKPFNERDLRTAIEVAVRKHELERNLADRERWFSTTLSSLGDAVIATDPAERITFMNPVAEAITGFSAEKAKGRPLSEIFRLVDDGGGALASPLRRALTDRFGVAMPSTAQLVDHGGQRRLVDDSAAPIIDDRGSLLGGVLVFRDVTDQKRLERRLEVSERMASLGTLASGIAHELNNPLAAVMGNVSFALEQLRSVQRRATKDNDVAARVDHCVDALEDASTATERLRKIIDTMRSFVGRRNTSREVLDVPDLLEPALKLSHNAVYHKAKLVRSYGTTPLVDVDEGQLVQVFVNLLSNAADAIPEGNAAENEIRVSTRTDDARRAVVEIRDTGVGIRQTDLARIFDPFFSTKGVGGGMGLGLAICHSFVAAAGGDLGVESEFGKGTVFRVSLPPASRKRTLKVSEPPVSPSARLRLLVLDDEATVAKVIQRMLSAHDVVVETDPHAALSRVGNREHFDVFFCDMMMPTMSGMDVYEAIHSANPELASKIVFLTGGAFSPRTIEFLEGSKNAVLTKPFTSEQLRATIEHLVPNNARAQ